MIELNELFKAKNQTFSFEFFPPKTELGFKKLEETIVQLAELKADFMSVTYGAGGGNREKTFDIVDQIQKKHKIIGVAHLTCIGSTKGEIQFILDEIRRKDISHILALRGDPPKDNPDWKPTVQHFHYSFELCRFIRQRYGDFFSIGVAGFPEGHILCPDRDLDAQYLRMKIDAGANYVITQLFFDNKDYFQYVERLRKLGVTARVIPGIIPITDYKGIVNFCKVCGTTIPKEVKEAFEPLQDDKEATILEGIRYAVRQCRELLDHGAPGIHFYTLNKISPIDIILSEIRK